MIDASVPPQQHHYPPQKKTFDPSSTKVKLKKSTNLRLHIIVHGLRTLSGEEVLVGQEVLRVAPGGRECRRRRDWFHVCARPLLAVAGSGNGVVSWVDVSRISRFAKFCAKTRWGFEASRCCFTLHRHPCEVLSQDVFAQITKPTEDKCHRACTPSRYSS